MPSRHPDVASGMRVLRALKNQGSLKRFLFVF
jgi:hypothetical protein